MVSDLWGKHWPRLHDCRHSRTEVAPEIRTGRCVENLLPLMALLGGDKTLAELAQRLEVYPNQITEWKMQLSERPIYWAVEPHRQSHRLI